MSFNRNILGENSKEDILRLVKSNEFKEIFKRNNIENVIIFGSLTKDDFNEESDIDIAIIGENNRYSGFKSNFRVRGFSRKKHRSYRYK